jgi:hypothetical protein
MPFRDATRAEKSIAGGDVQSKIGAGVVAVGWIFHLFVSSVFGAIYGLFLGDRAKTYGSGALYGVGYGIFWWVGGALIAMPVFVGHAAIRVTADA